MVKARQFDSRVKGVNTALPPPEGYASWLDYADDHFDTRDLAAAGLFADNNIYEDRSAVRAAALEELAALGACAQSAQGSQ